MLKSYHFIPHGVCSREMDIVLDGDVISEVTVHGGCPGNSQGVAALIRGMKVQDAIERLSGIRCGFKETSCPDQLAKGLLESLSETENS